MHKIIHKFVDNYNRRKELLYTDGLFKYIKNSSGYVLIVVMLVIALLITMSTEFFMVAQTNINYIKKFSERLKAGMIAKAGMNLATLILQADKIGISQTSLGREAVNKNIDSYRDMWAVNFPELPIENGGLKLVIDDENSKINLSILSNEIVDSTPYYGITQRFFLNMGLLMDYADIIKDWVDIDDSRSPYGAESEFYLNIPAAYKGKNAAMDSIDELMMVKDMTPEIFYGMEKGPYEKANDFVEHNKGDITIGPDFISKLVSQNKSGTSAEKEKMSFNIAKEKSKKLTDYLRVNGDRKDFTNDLNKININTAPYRVLLALTDKMTDDTVKELINRRLTKPFTNVEEVKDLIDDDTVRKNLLSVKSYLFKITAAGNVNNTKVKITGIYYRDSKAFLYWSEQ